MNELARALERETLNSIGGTPCPVKMGRPRAVLPKPKTKRAPTEIEKTRAALKRKLRLADGKMSPRHRIDRMMWLACPKRRRYAA
jgi:hypothetical protein